MKQKLQPKKKSTAMRILVLILAAAVLLGFIILPLMQ